MAWEETSFSILNLPSLARHKILWKDLRKITCLEFLYFLLFHSSSPPERIWLEEKRRTGEVEIGRLSLIKNSAPSFLAVCRSWRVQFLHNTWWSFHWWRAAKTWSYYHLASLSLLPEYEKRACSTLQHHVEALHPFQFSNPTPMFLFPTFNTPSSDYWRSVGWVLLFLERNFRNISHYQCVNIS